MSSFSNRFKHRNMASRPLFSFIIVTMFLITASIFTAFFTQVGRKAEKAHFLFFAERGAHNQLAEEYESLIHDWEIAEANGDEVSIEQIMLRLEEINKIAHAKPEPFHDIMKGQVWRLFTPMLLHFGVLHIVFNMMWLWQFGIILETRFGSWKYLGMILLISAAANIPQAILVHTNFGGMSGVNYGLFGFLMMRNWLHPDPGFFLRKEIIAWMLIWLVVCMTGTVGNVANHAHVAGMLCGALLGTIHAMQAGAWKILRRRSEFRAAYNRSEDSLYRCSVCGATEKSHPDRNFAVYIDGNDYCDLHLPKGDQ